MTNDADSGPRPTLEELAAAAGPPVEVIGASVLQTAAQLGDELGGIEAHLRDSARELLAARARLVELGDICDHELARHCRDTCKEAGDPAADICDRCGLSIDDEDPTDG